MLPLFDFKIFWFVDMWTLGHRGPNKTNQWFCFSRKNCLWARNIFSDTAMFQDLNENIIKNNLRKDIEDLLLQANMAKLKKVAAITEKNLHEEEELQLHQNSAGRCGKDERPSCG